MMWFRTMIVYSMIHLLLWKDSDRYEGDFINGQRTGKGTYIWSNGKQYFGDFIDDLMSGQGVYIWPNGDRYEGAVINSERTGEGLSYYQNGDSYKGHYINGMKNGFGTHTYQNGDSLYGTWKDDLLIDGTFIDSSDHSEYVGNYKSVKSKKKSLFGSKTRTIKETMKG